VHERWNTDPRPVHLVAHIDDDLPVVQSAAVVVADEPATTVDTARVDVPHTGPPARRPNRGGQRSRPIVVGIRPDIEVHLVPRTAGIDQAAWASAVHACVVSGVKLIEIGRITLRAGPTSGTADLSQEAASRA
jgi:hypothetical protein